MSMLQDILHAVIIAAVPVLTTYLVKFLISLFNWIGLKTEESALSSTLYEIRDLILNVVTSTTQTYVDSLKAAGKFDKESQEEAFRTTKNTILLLLSEESKEVIKALYSDLDAWLDVQIEAAVREVNKKEGE